MGECSAANAILRVISKANAVGLVSASNSMVALETRAAILSPRKLTDVVRQQPQPEGRLMWTCSTKDAGIDTTPVSKFSRTKLYAKSERGSKSERVRERDSER